MIKLSAVAIGALLLGLLPALAQTAVSPSSPSAPPSANVPGRQPSEMSSPGAQRAMTMSEQEARNAFERAGYTSIGDVKPDEDGYSATAVKDGQVVKIGVDLDGTVETLN
jgi:hypothetical protein